MTLIDLTHTWRKSKKLHTDSKTHRFGFPHEHPQLPEPVLGAELRSRPIAAAALGVSEMAAFTLKVGNCPENKLALTNRVYLSANDFNRLKGALSPTRATRSHSLCCSSSTI